MTDHITFPTSVACRIVGMDPDLLNTHISQGLFRCAPSTKPGKARLFDNDHLLALWLFRAFLDRGYKVKEAGYFACEIANRASSHPEVQVFSIVHTTSGSRSIHPATMVPSQSEWDKVEFPMRGMIIHDVHPLDITHVRELIARRVEEETNG